MVASMLLLSGRQLIGMMLSFGRLALIVTLLAPADYGLYAVAAGLMTYITAVGSLGIGTYLIRATEMDPVRIGTARALLLAVGGSTTLLVWLLAPALGRWYEAHALVPLLMLQALTVPVELLKIIPLGLAERELAYRRIATIDLGAELFGFLFAFAVVATTRSPIGLALAALLQQALALILYSRVTGEWRTVAWAREEVRAQLRFGLGLGLVDWVWQLRLLVNPLLVAKLLGAEAAGLVAVAVRLADVGGVLRHIIWRIYLAGAAKLRRDGRALGEALAEVQSGQPLAVGACLVLLVALAPELVAWMPHEAGWHQLMSLLPLLVAAVAVNAGFNLYGGTLVLLGALRPMVIFNSILVLLFYLSALVMLHLDASIRSYGIAELCAACGYPLVLIPLKRRLSSVRSWPAHINLVLVLLLLALVTQLLATPLWLRLLVVVGGIAAIVGTLPSNRRLVGQLLALRRQRAMAIA